MTSRSPVQAVPAGELLEEKLLLDKVSILKPTIKNSLATNFKRKIAPQHDGKNQDCFETASLSTIIALTEPSGEQNRSDMSLDKQNRGRRPGKNFEDKDDDKEDNECNIETSVDSDGDNDDAGELDDVVGTTNIAAKSAMFEYLSDNIDNLQIDKSKSRGRQIESSSLKSFEKLTSEVVKDSCDDRSLLAILKTNGWTGSRYKNTPTTALNPNALLLAFLNLHLSRKANDQNLVRLNDKKSLRNIISRGASARGFEGLKNDNCTDENDNNDLSGEHMKDDLLNDTNKRNSNDEDEDLYYEQIQSFCPNILLRHLT